MNEEKISKIIVQSALTFAALRPEGDLNAVADKVLEELEQEIGEKLPKEKDDKTAIKEMPEQVEFINLCRGFNSCLKEVNKILTEVFGK